MVSSGICALFTTFLTLRDPPPPSSFAYNFFTKMKFLNWMQNKLHGSKGKNKQNPVSANHHMVDIPCKDEFIDWPEALLAIGTFGNDNLKEDTRRIIAEHLSSSQACVQEFTPHDEEEEGDFHNELKMCLRGQVESNLATDQEEFPADQMNNDSDSEKKETFYPNSSLIPCRGKDLCLDNSKSGLGKKSLTFLLKKMFVCRSGFQRTPSLSDSLSTESRMEKILRAILNKKIYPQGSNSTMVIKKYLENKQMAKSDNDEDELYTAANDGSKWVKTDSEYIVLEI